MEAWLDLRRQSRPLLVLVFGRDGRCILEVEWLMKQSTHAIAAVEAERDQDERITSINASVDGRKSNVVVRCMAVQFGLVQSPNCTRMAPLNNLRVERFDQVLFFLHFD